MTTDPNLKVQINHETRTIELRQSAIQTFLNCPRRFYWEYVEGLQPNYPDRVRPWTTPDTGTAFHKAMEAYYLGGDPLEAWRGWSVEEFGEVHPDADADLIDIMVEGHIDDLMSEGADVGETTVAVEVPIQAKLNDTVRMAQRFVEHFKATVVANEETRCIKKRQPPPPSRALPIASLTWLTLNALSPRLFYAVLCVARRGRHSTACSARCSLSVKRWQPAMHGRRC